MNESDVSADGVIAELVNMGFDFTEVLQAIEVVGPCLDEAVDFILNRSSIRDMAQTGHVTHGASTSSSQIIPSRRSPMSRHYPRRMKQSNITDPLLTFGSMKRNNPFSSSASFSGTRNARSRLPDGKKFSNASMNEKFEPSSVSFQQHCNASVQTTELNSLQEKVKTESQNFSDLCSLQLQQVDLNWEEKVGSILQKHFGILSLKPFQKEAMQAWLSHRDCLILAATGSGKSLCFQLPAILTRKVVVVISPLISLMHDQCLKLAKHGVSACFLGSGQADRSVESKAMCGMYKVVYVCPETVARLIEPLKGLADKHGIALFAVDEVHCVSKWGHDFRPDYRRLSVLRENFRDVPLMALTATATLPVREDIIKSLCMSSETKIILTSFFRPNLLFSVKHSRTSSMSSYHKDFHELIKTYATKKVGKGKGSNHISNDMDDDSDSSCGSLDASISDADEKFLSDKNLEDTIFDDNDENLSSEIDKSAVSSDGNQLTVEYLEDDELDIHHGVDDLDVSCGEYPAKLPAESLKFGGTSPNSNIQGSLEDGPTIIYVPTRKETVRIADFLSKSGIRAAAYHAKLPKTQLRRVHGEFHQNSLEVVVATVAFGMGIDKSNVRRIIHYGWPQSLEEYYQEAGRAGRDGKLSECVLYANLCRIPTLLPSQRSEEQTRHAYKMLSDCFRYGMNTATCRAKILVNYFGEEFAYDGCHLCDICLSGAPKLQNMKEEADIFIRALKAHHVPSSFGSVSHSGAIYSESSSSRIKEKPSLKMIVSRIREQYQKFAASDRLWWQGLARILENKGYIREGADMTRVSIKYPEPTEKGLKFLLSGSDLTLYEYPEADMLISTRKEKPYSSFAEWGRGWADPKIRRQRLQRKNCKTRKRKRHFGKHSQDLSSVRGRLTAKLSKHKH